MSYDVYYFNVNVIKENGSIFPDKNGNNILIERGILVDNKSYKKNKLAHAFSESFFAFCVFIFISLIALGLFILEIDIPGTILFAIGFMAFLSMVSYISAYNSLAPQLYHHLSPSDKNYYQFYGYPAHMFTYEDSVIVEENMKKHDYYYWTNLIVKEGNYTKAKSLLAQAKELSKERVKITEKKENTPIDKYVPRTKDNSSNYNLEKKNDSSTQNNINNPQYKNNIEDRVNYARKEYGRLATMFTNVHTNPEILIYKPLLLDLSSIPTQNMVNSYNDLRKLMDRNHYENISKIEKLIEKARNDFAFADSEATRIGIPGLSNKNRDTAIKSLRIVLDDASTDEEKKSHWENVVKIARKAGVKDSIVSAVNSKVLLSIDNKKQFELESF